MHEKNQIRKKQYLAWLPACMFAAAIFWFSAQPADISTEMSDSVTKLLLRIAEATGLLELSPQKVYRLCRLSAVPIRKAAHITEYMVFHVTVLYALRRWNMRGEKWLLRALAITVFYACTDEFHQLFVPGRAGRITDVMIDSTGVLIITWILWKGVRKNERRTEKDHGSH